MTFASPLIVAAGFLAVAIPVLLHLFFRRKHQPIQWAAMDLLRVAVTQTTKRRKLNKLLLLVLRSLVVASAGLAIAGPLIPKSIEQAQTTEGAPRELILVLDNGVSQRTTDSSGEAFATSKQQTITAIENLQPGDSVGVILTATAQPLVWPPSRDLTAARLAVESSVVSSAPSDIAAAIELTQGGTKTIGVISAFRHGSLSSYIENNQNQPSGSIVVTPPNQNDVANIQLIKCEPQARGPSSSRGGIPLRLHLAREGDTLGEVVSNIDIALDEAIHNTVRVEWKEGQVESVVESTIIPTGAQRTEVPVRATIIDHDAQMADNVRFSVVTTTNTIRVGVIDRVSDVIVGQSGQTVGEWIERALAPTDDGDIETETIDPTSVDPKRCQGFDALVVIRPDLVDTTGWGVLKQLVVSGKVLIVVPPAHTTNNAWSDGLLLAFDLGWTVARTPTTSDPAETITQPEQFGENTTALLRQLAPELQDLTQPIAVNQWFQITVPLGRGESVLAMSGGSPLIAVGTPEDARGSVIVFATPPDLTWTNLPAKPLMVPLFQECVRQAVARVDRERNVVVGSDHIQNLPSTITTLQLVMGTPDSQVEETRIVSVGPNGSLATPILTPGVYSSQDATGHTLGLLVANIDVAAASTKRATIDEVTRQFKSTSVTVSASDFGNNKSSSATDATQQPQARALNGHSLAIWFFCAMITLVLVETWMARHASIGATTRSTVGAQR